MKSLQMVLAEHPCGECTACCHVMGVNSLHKPFNVDCVHLTAKRCSIYATRPPECSGFECLWRVGGFDLRWFGEADYRPDKLGIVMNLESESGKDYLDFFEVREGALRAFGRDRSMKLLRWLRREIGPVKAIRLFPVGARIACDFEQDAKAYGDKCKYGGRDYVAFEDFMYFCETEEEAKQLVADWFK
jgi:hypothetical protein